MTDTPGPEDQPDPSSNDAGTPRDNYIRATQRMARLLRRQIESTCTFDTVRASANIAAGSAELGGLLSVLIAKGVVSADEFYQAAAEVAVIKGNKLFAELNAPKIALPGDVNGSGGG